MTPLFLTGNDPSPMVFALGGGKAGNLSRMTKLNLSVPPWFVITTAVFDEVVKHAAIDLHPPTNKKELAAFAQSIEDAFIACELPQTIVQSLQAQLHHHGLADTFVAVRSSGIDEDSRDHSFAGQFSSFLFQKGYDQIALAIKQCFASGFSERALSYRLENNLSCSDIKVGVVIQKMVNASVSGVVFSRNPINLFDRHSLLNSATYGLGEGLVSGALDADEYQLDRDSSTIQAIIAQKSKAFRQKESGGLYVADVEEEESKKPCLSDAQNQEIKQLALHLENTLGVPQDIEWAYEQDKLFCLQTRPITVCPPSSFYDEKINGNKTVLWDNANIIESYSGVTSPLTFSFASRAYRQVYIQFLQMMGIDNEEIADNETVFRNMLGHVRGRIYYNLVNWYKVLSYLPLKNNSEDFMETMMGLKGKLPEDIRCQLKNPTESAFKKKKRKIYVLGTTLLRFINKKHIVKQFKDNFNHHYNHERQRDFRALSLPEQLDTYNHLERVILNKWQAPIVNDFLCMVFFGLLKKLTENWIGEKAPASLQNDLLCGQGHIESTEPTKMLMAIAMAIDEGDNVIRERFLQADVHELRTLLKSDGPFKNIAQKVEKFLELYGFRSADELKLEEPDLHEDPSFALRALQNYVKSKSYNVKDLEQREQTIRNNAEALVKNSLSGSKLWFYSFVLKHARWAVATRESLRFDRTKIFGIMRHLFRAMGSNFQKLKLIEDEADIFYLELSEIIAFIEGRSSALPISDLIQTRKAQFAMFRAEEALPDRFVTRGVVCASEHYRKILMDGDIFSEPVKESDDPSLLYGISCCPGQVVGTVLATDDINEAQKVEGCILATTRTDPGWVPLYPTCSGLIIERGSLLSHSAVVARELGLPTVVGVKGLMKRIQSGQRVELDAAKGVVRIL